MRYHTEHKVRAFWLAEEKNKFEVNEKKWRVARRVRNRVVIDVDGSDMSNLKHIVEYYSNIFGRLTVTKSSRGYHIWSDIKPQDKIKYLRAKVLHPLLEEKDTTKYIVLVKEWARPMKKKGALAEEVQIEFPKSGLYCGVGSFDIMFALLPLLRGYYCVRISKRDESDKLEKVSLFP